MKRTYDDIEYLIRTSEECLQNAYILLKQNYPNWEREFKDAWMPEIVEEFGRSRYYLSQLKRCAWEWSVEKSRKDKNEQSNTNGKNID